MIFYINFYFLIIFYLKTINIKKGISMKIKHLVIFTLALLFLACVSKPNNSEIKKAIRQNIESSLPKSISSSTASKDILITSLEIQKIGKKKSLSIPDAAYEDTWWPVRVFVQGSYQPCKIELIPSGKKKRNRKYS